MRQEEEAEPLAGHRAAGHLCGLHGAAVRAVKKKKESASALFFVFMGDIFRKRLFFQNKGVYFRMVLFK